ncbi:MAG: hypothetical protein QNK23_00075 [Crocinitomicaceae bacterium]|nr:hypothetical protein [Crocinitomicaceae bacterium]
MGLLIYPNQNNSSFTLELKGSTTEEVNLENVLSDVYRNRSIGLWTA